MAAATSADDEATLRWRRADASTPVAAGEIEIRAQVRVTVAIK